jgi:hypothetical protein
MNYEGELLVSATVQIPLVDLCRDIAKRGPSRNEATLQADIRTLLMHGVKLPDNQVVSIEDPTNDGTRRRIDVAVGRTVIELKKDLRTPEALAALEQLAAYVKTKSSQCGDRYVGVLTDGQEWRLYFLEPNEHLLEVASFYLDEVDPDVDGLIAWIGAVLAIAQAVPPTPTEVERSFGATSPAYRLDIAEITALYEQCKSTPEVQLKRELWAKLLTTAFGTGFTDEVSLFLNHTYLVVVAEVIAHAVVGLNPADPAYSADSLLSGAAFSGVDITGVVEADFFDWILLAPGGAEFAKRIARRVAAFQWAAVEHDILKTLYESVINREERHQLGEYYTPDWLADKVVERVVDDPLNQRVADLACGSGTFIFHAVRRYMEASKASGFSLSQSMSGVTTQVVGIDVHPVAVTLARVTYLLALGRDNLADPERPSFHVPIYLGDALQWEQNVGLFGSGGLAIPTGGGTLWGDELRFPDSLLHDARRFDQFVIKLAELASERPPGSPRPQIESLLQNFNIPTVDQAEIRTTYGLMCDLHDSGHDHIWSYYVRNLVRPLWLARSDNKVDRLVGNPPWLAYRHMTDSMKFDFREASKQLGIWTGGRSATQQDLSAYFVVKAVSLYLREGGKFGFVLPRSTLRARQYEGFRTARYGGKEQGYFNVGFKEVWDLESVRPFLFPVPSCVVFGISSPGKAGRMPTDTLVWSGELENPNEKWAVAADTLITTPGNVEVAFDAVSIYARRFYQGATFLPIVLCRVTLPPPGPLGVPAGSRKVRATASTRAPWNTVEPSEGIVEAQFVRKIYESDSIAAFRILDPEYAVVPVAGDKVVSPVSEEGPAPLDSYPKMSAWWTARNSEWLSKRSSTSPETLWNRINYNRSLEIQLPPATYRVLYNTSGSILRAAILNDPAGLVDHGAYWANANSIDEARYLIGVLNSAVLLQHVNPQQATGLYGTRHFHKTPFTVDIPEYSPQNELHQAIAEIARRLCEVANTVQPPTGRGVVAYRRLIRRTVIATGDYVQLNETVAKMLGLPITQISDESTSSQG